MWSESFVNGAERNTKLAELQRKVGTLLKKKIEELVPEENIRKLNKEMGTAIEVREALNKIIDKTSGKPLASVTEAGAITFGGLPGAGLVGLRKLAGSTAGATTVSKLLSMLGTGATQTAKQAPKVINLVGGQAGSQVADTLLNGFGSFK